MIEDLKQELLGYLNKLDNVNLSTTPGFIFLKYLDQELMHQNTKLWSDCGNEILANIKIDLTGLGDWYEPHEKFLREAAVLWAKMIIKVHKEINVSFPDTQNRIFFNQLKSLTFTLT